ncbi:ribosome biogenesis GTPase Der [Tundrisphaera lichenicola]|uniref:ribosome biogenesis GTPase Der n=1 Tax=Tundrisphaera lichenicola TaxID=2029860 RepID=UPI003EB93BD7
MALPKVVIVGRPNVGKSSLFNWIVGRRIAIVDDMSGVTRDRVGSLAQAGDEDDPRFFELVDTGGIGMVDRDDLSDDVDRQIETAINEADVILFVVDVRDGVMPLDEEVASRLRYIQKTPVLLVINKSDTPEMDSRGGEFYKLGRGKPVYISTQQNRNKKQLLKMIAERLPDVFTAKPSDEVMKIAVVGRPNTGKSTFINTLAHAERMIVSERPGTTRDSVDVRFELDGLPFVAIDTAGVKRKAKIKDSLDFYSIHRAERSIRRADVVLLFLDPTQGISRLDKQMADYIAKQYKPCIFTVNKWDLMVNNEDVDAPGMGRFATMVQHAFRNMAYMPLAFITAATGRNVKALLNLSQSMYKQAGQRVGTGTLNRILREAVEAHSPPGRDNRIPRIYYATQVGSAPPTIVLFVNSPSLFDSTYQRYLLNVFRERLPFKDVPIKLYLRARTQSDPNAPKGVDEDQDPTSDLGSRSEGRWYESSNNPVGRTRLDREVNELLTELEQ